MFGAKWVISQQFAMHVCGWSRLQNKKIQTWDIARLQHLEGAWVLDHMGSSQGFQSVRKQCEALQGLLALTHHSHTAQLQQVTQLDDDLTHCAVGSIQDHAVSWLHQGKKSSS